MSTILILLFLIHPGVFKANLSVFSCTELEPGEFWLSDDLNEQCWDTFHSKFSLMICATNLIIWGFAFPVTVLFLMMKNRRSLDLQVTKLKYGYIFMGYTRGKFYWEFVIFYRKMFIAFISVFLTLLDPAI